MPVPVVHQFAYGVVNPLIAFAMALVGSLFGLMCTSRVQHSADRRQRIRWLLVASAAIGGAGGWLANMMAMLGFDIPSSPMRYDIAGTAFALLIGIIGVAVALLIVGLGRDSIVRILLGGLCLGVAVAAMDYLGLVATRMHGSFTYQPQDVAACVLIGVVGSIAALGLTVRSRRDRVVVLGSVVFAITILATHYSLVATVGVRVAPGPDNLPGMAPTTLILPIVVIALLALLFMLFAGLNLGADDQFAARPRRAPIVAVAPVKSSTPIHISWVPESRPEHNGDPASMAAFERFYAESRWRRDDREY